MSSSTTVSTPQIQVQPQNSSYNWLKLAAITSITAFSSIALYRYIRNRNTIKSALSTIRKRTIAVDLDEVLGEFINPLIEFHNLEYNTLLTLADFHSYHFSDVWGGTTEEACIKVDRFFHSQHFNDIPVIPSAYSVLAEFAHKFDYVLVTSRQLSIESNTKQWINKHYPNIFTEDCLESSTLLLSSGYSSIPINNLTIGSELFDDNGNLCTILSEPIIGNNKYLYSIQQNIIRNKSNKIFKPYLVTDNHLIPIVWRNTPYIETSTNNNNQPIITIYWWEYLITDNNNPTFIPKSHSLNIPNDNKPLMIIENQLWNILTINNNPSICYKGTIWNITAESLYQLNLLYGNINNIKTGIKIGGLQLNKPVQLLQPIQFQLIDDVRINKIIEFINNKNQLTKWNNIMENKYQQFIKYCYSTNGGRYSINPNIILKYDSTITDQYRPIRINDNCSLLIVLHLPLNSNYCWLNERNKLAKQKLQVQKK